MPHPTTRERVPMLRVDRDNRPTLQGGISYDYESTAEVRTLVTAVKLLGSIALALTCGYVLGEALFVERERGAERESGNEMRSEP